jgi:homoserine kinase type II
MYTRRLDFDGDINTVLNHACGAFGVGKLVSGDPIANGYEDYNFQIRTTSGKYVLKIFSHSRESWEIPRLVSIYETVRNNGLAAPKLHLADGRALYSYAGLDMIMMDWIDGKTYYELGAPNDDDLRQIVENAARIHKVNFPELDFRIDTFAVQNRHALMDETRSAMSRFPEEYEFVKNAIAEFDKIPYADLPHAFCHGDISKQNTIRRDIDGKIFHLDWSVANIYPRIHDLVVIVTELTYKNGRSLAENVKIIQDIYSEFSPLTSLEYDVFMDYVRGAITTLFMYPVQLKYVLKSGSKQDDFFIQNARDMIMEAQR